MTSDDWTYPASFSYFCLEGEDGKVEGGRGEQPSWIGLRSPVSLDTYVSYVQSKGAGPVLLLTSQTQPPVYLLWVGSVYGP